MRHLARILRPPPGFAAAWDRSLGRARRATARHRWVGHAAALLAVVCGAWVGWSALSSLDHARDAWGDTVAVVVADVALAPGDRADAATVSVRRWPVALAPADAIHEVPDAVVRQHVGPGEPIGAGDVGRGEGAVAMLDPGEAAVAVTVDESRRPTLRVGDRVGVVVGDQRVANGEVIEVDPTTVLVAVPTDAAPAIAAAGLSDEAALLLER